MAHGGSSNLKSGIINFIAGSLGGVAVVYVGQPLDTVKVKMQTFPHMYEGMCDCLKVTIKQDGVIKGLYAGTTPALLANVAENSVLFCAYGFCQKFVCKLTGKERVQDLSVLDNATAGFFAAFFSSFTLCPTELIKCRLQAIREINWHARGSQTATPGTVKAINAPTQTTVEAHSRTTDNAEKAAVTDATVETSVGPATQAPAAEMVQYTPWTLTKKIYREQGIRGMFCGLIPTIMREMPGYFFFFGGYEGAREILKKEGESKDEMGFLKTMIAGGIGGFVLWAIIFPIDVIKSRVQISDKRMTILKVTRDIIRSGGVLALYNGLKPMLLRTIPATAALFVVVEYSKKCMHAIFGD